MPPPNHHDPFEEPSHATATATALIDTVLHTARITALHPNRLTIVGDGRRVRIDAAGAADQPLTQVRLAVALSATATTAGDLQRRLGRWAALATTVRVHEIVCAGDRFDRVLHLADADGEAVMVDNGRLR